jgi:FolB domain-containing protein
MRRATPKGVQGGNDDAIHIEQLELFACVGVTEEERAKPQRLACSITLWPKTSFETLQDDIARTIDYSAVCAAVGEFVEKRSDKLIETLAQNSAGIFLKDFARQIRIEVRKFVLANARYRPVIVAFEPAKMRTHFKQWRQLRALVKAGSAWLRGTAGSEVTPPGGIAGWSNCRSWFFQQQRRTAQVSS